MSALHFTPWQNCSITHHLDYNGSWVTEAISDFALGVAIAGHVLFDTWWSHCLPINYKKTVDDATMLL